MNNDYLFEAVPVEKLELADKKDLIEFLKLEQEFRIRLQKENAKLKAEKAKEKQEALFIADQYVLLKSRFFGKSSERKASPGTRPDLEPKKKGKKVQLPSERYPNTPLVEKEIELSELPTCGACGEQMKDSGLTEDSEYLTVIPKQYMIIRQKRHKYCCGHCHGDIKTAPALPRIKAGSGYSDEIILDASLSKYCDLIPMERYAAMASRQGLIDLPPSSLIEGSHYLADYVEKAYEKLRDEIKAAPVLHADETPHRMLEGSSTSSWYLWGFSTTKSSYFEAHPTRSGDVAFELLKQSQCRVLVSDVYSGYHKAVRITNEERKKQEKSEIVKAYCNAHARRKFTDAEENYPDECKYFIEQYQKIYQLDMQSKGMLPEEVIELRKKILPYFEAMKKTALDNLQSYSEKSLIYTALAYFLKNYDGLTYFLENSAVPIDNNQQERLLRNPVIGRKTWYGTHSKLGAKTACILFSLVESCKLNKINPREYFKKLVDDLHAGKPAYTPAEFKPSV